VKPDQAGRVLGGKYELVEQLGQGGMAVVWKAIARGAANFQRPVALKRIDASCRGFEEVVAMFIEEARVGSTLRHPNIVQVEDFGVDEHGVHYMVTELVDGIHLGRWIESYKKVSEPTPWEAVTAIAVEVLRALDAAHSRVDAHGQSKPILHRDVTPPNILLDNSGVIKLADFGLARSMDRGQMTRPNVVKGKLSYLAPELLLGAPPSSRSDLFALGIVMWEALTAERLFDGPSDVDVVTKLRDAHVPLLSMKRGNLPVQLTSIVHRALERQPEARFASAREMLHSLTAILRILPRSVDAPVLAATIARARSRLAAK
jgi:serine/threonine-protein kinase